MKKILTTLLIVLLTFCLFGCSAEKKEAKAAFENAVAELNNRTEELKVNINDLQSIIDEGETPLDTTTIDDANDTILKAYAAIKEAPEMLKEVEDINKQTSELNAISYEKEIKAMDEVKKKLNDSIAQYKQVTNPSEDFVLSRLANVEEIIGMEPATEDNDPNNHLHKQGGYTSDIFFASSNLNQNKIYPYNGTILEKGTDAGGSVEVYETVDGAEQRNSYLASFDGTVFSSGYHMVIGTIVIRTSNELNATQQKDLAQAIVDALIELK